MHTQVEQAIHNFANTYQKLYPRQTLDMYPLDGQNVMVGGVTMLVSDLERITASLENEYRDAMLQKREVVERLIDWCKQ